MKDRTTPYRHQRIFCLVVLSIIFGATLWSARLNTAIKIGADEDYELSKVLLFSKGFRFYTEVWNDQPLLHTAMAACIVKNVSPSVAGPRLLTAAFAGALLISLFFLVESVNGFLTSIIAVIFLFASPGFIDLSCSCMVEIPALAPAVVGMAILQRFRKAKTKLLLITAGLLVAIGLQIKLIVLILFPIIALVVMVGDADAREPSVDALSAQPNPKYWKLIIKGRNLALVFLASGVGFLVINCIMSEGSFFLQTRQMWLSHFASARSLEYGSAADFRFDWKVMFKNWDQTLPAVIGIGVCLINIHRKSSFFLPVAWFFHELIVFGIHSPWWSYYYVHNAVPMCWLAAIGVVFAFEKGRAKKSRLLWTGTGLFVLCACAWMVSRVYLQITTIRYSPQTYNSLVLTEIKRFKSLAEFMFTDEGVYSFHAGIPLPPHLAVLSLKRFWSGDMTNEKFRAELWNVKPGIILLRTDAAPVPYQDLLQSQYSMVFEDQTHRLYARKDIVKLVVW